MSSPSARLRRWSLAALVTNVLIVVTGGAVRVTGSGLGCPEWPACEQGSVVPPPGGEAGWHQLIEFGNRLLSLVVLAAVVGAFVVARRELARGDRRRRLAGLLVVGVLAQAVLGGVTVRLGLHWATVASHFLLSMALIAIATVLHHRVATGVEASPSRPQVPPARGARPVRAARLVPVLAAVVLVLGTIVTAVGPHAGDPGTARLGLSVPLAARSHSFAVWTVVALTVYVLVRARRVGARPLARATGARRLVRATGARPLARATGARRLVRATGVLLALEVVQGAVGYWQYLVGVPPMLVLAHMLLATLFWIAAVRVGLAAGDPIVTHDTQEPNDTHDSHQPVP